MTLKLADKQTIVEDVIKCAENSTALIAAEYLGMKVAEFLQLRTLARSSGIRIRVVRNTLASRALSTTKFSAMCDKLEGALVLVFAKDDPGAAARLLQDFSKKCEALRVVAISLGDGVLPGTSLPVVASLPTRDQAIAQLWFTMHSPIMNLMRIIAEPYAQVVRATVAFGDKKQ